METFGELVQQGIALLDSSDAVPSDWRTMVNWETLDMQSLNNCVLAQLFGSFISAPGAIRACDAFIHPENRAGCGIDEDAADAWYFALDEAWRSAMASEKV